MLERPIIQFASTDSHAIEMRKATKWNFNFHDFVMNPDVPAKEYLDIKVAFHYPCFRNLRATFYALDLLRRHFPTEHVHLISDHGSDFLDIAKHYLCDYTYTDTIVGDGYTNNLLSNPKCMEWLNRIKTTCEMYPSVDWIIYMEDDVRVNDSISRWPDAHIAGHSSPKYKKPAIDYLRQIHPDLEIRDWSGSGGTIFHRESFLYCMEHMFDLDYVRSLDDRIPCSSDALISYLFQYNGFLCRRWLDCSCEVEGLLAPGAAFDHGHKIYYGTQWGYWELDAKVQSWHKSDQYYAAY